MLYTISRGNVPGCPEVQTPILHLVSTAEAIAQHPVPFAFTDGHAVMSYSTFYNSLDDLDAIDWDLMRARMWNDTDEDGDRKRRRQAEFLVHEFVPWSLIIGIGVINPEIQHQTEEILHNMNQTTRVRVRPSWYYSHLPPKARASRVPLKNQTFGGAARRQTFDSKKDARYETTKMMGSFVRS